LSHSTRLKNISLPHGSALDWDMKTLTVDQLKYELNLCSDILYGVWLPEYNSGLKGMLNETADDRNVSEKMFEKAKAVWLKRYQRAETELFERAITDDN